MWYTNYLKEFVQSLLPYSSELVILEKPSNKPAIIITDLDNHMMPEIIAAYKLGGEIYIVVLKYYEYMWHIIDTVKGKGYNVNYLDVGPITDSKAKNVIVGWQIGGIWSELGIYEWADEKLKSLIDEDIVFSRIEVKDMPSEQGRDGKEEIALWVHDTGEAYMVDVYRWSNGSLVPAHNVYPYYFKKVAAYYEKLVKEYHDYAFYWYYLADAQLKSKMTEKALESINMAISLNKEYPSKEELLKLKKEITTMHLLVQ